ncbi:MAG TPA: COX15/CtaA family protein [Tepidisphaeraceae bacterium]|nr:COX15/CtaA family protein [Tepidisphaeraceae bacterium]
MNVVRYNPLLHRTAQLTAAATLFLIFMGGLVTSHGAGMSVPDWPNSYGYNMFTFPVSKWVGGIFYEHTHRLMGTVVGVLSIALTIIAFKIEPRRWVRWLAASVLGAVISQGVLGGLRVVFVELNLAIIHACVAQAFFCMAALVAVVTSRWWIETSPAARIGSNRLVRLAAISVLAIYLQLIVGAMMRHYQAGLAIPDFPLNYGKWLPPTNSEELSQAYASRAIEAIDVSNPNPSLGQVWLHFGHRIGALVISLLLTWTIAYILINEKNAGIRRLAICLITLLVCQITLGILTVLMHKPADIASFHVAAGALTLMTTFVLLVRSMRLYSTVWRSDWPQSFEISDLNPDKSFVPA